MALLACSFFFIQTSNAEEALTPLALAGNEDGSDDSDDADKTRPVPRRSRTHGRVTADGTRLPETDPTLALVTASFETQELIIEGAEVPLEYPALPEVEGTRINSGKKTSFVRPEEFPSIANNDYRELLATTPGLLVSEEPSSPIVNFGYCGLDSQHSEFMQILKDGVSINRLSLLTS